MTARRVLAIIAILLALGATGASWLAIGGFEDRASSSADEAADAMASIETSVEGSADAVAATADAVGAAAVALEAATATSDSTSQVASDVADTAASLGPVLESLADGIDDVDTTLGAVRGLLLALPFDTGVDPDQLSLDPDVTDIDPLVADLDDAEASLRTLSDDAAGLGTSTSDLADSLLALEAELRVSAEDLGNLEDEVADARSTFEGLTAADGSGDLDLTPLRLVVAALGLAIAAACLPDALGLDRRSRPAGSE